MKQYLDLINDIVNNGTKKPSGRDNMPDTIFIPFSYISHDLNDGFPLLTTKKMYWKGIIHELLWFLRGETNIKYLVDNKVNIWNGDAFRWYQKKCVDNDIDIYFKTIDDFIETIKKLTYVVNNGTLTYMIDINKFSSEIIIHLSQLGEKQYLIGDLGKVYGYQWRNQNGIDQIVNIIDGLKNNPYSRYHILDGWNRSDFNEMALPPCHLLYHFITKPNNNGKNTLNLNMYQRSVDVGLGLGFNLASMSLLLLIISKIVDMVPGKIVWIGGDTHIYENHIPHLIEQSSREPFKLPEIKINKELKSISDIESLTIDDFELLDYQSHPKINLELFTGYKIK